MSLNDSLTDLLKGQVGALTLMATPPENGGLIVAELQHHVRTGEASEMMIKHKAEDKSVTGVVQQLISQYNQAELQRTKLALPKAPSKIIKP